MLFASKNIYEYYHIWFCLTNSYLCGHRIPGFVSSMVDVPVERVCKRIQKDVHAANAYKISVSAFVCSKCLVRSPLFLSYHSRDLQRGWWIIESIVSVLGLVWRWYSYLVIVTVDVGLEWEEWVYESRVETTVLRRRSSQLARTCYRRWRAWSTYIPIAMSRTRYLADMVLMQW